jgi:hypothetical protein
MRLSDSAARAFVSSFDSFWKAKRVAWSLRGFASMSKSRAWQRKTRQRQVEAVGGE